MNPTIQPGMHPDADSLTAFAEELLPVQEREQIVAHMATCGRCREVVFLARQAADEDRAVVPASAVEKKLRASWSGGWRWAWVPVGALATVIGIAVVSHFRRAETEKQMALNESAMRVTPEQTASSPAPAANESRAVEKAEPSQKTLGKPIERRKDAPRDAEENKALLREGSGLGKGAPPIVLSPGIAAGSVHGAFAARAKSSPYGGPMANDQLQQQNTAQQQNALQQQNANRQQAPIQQPAMQTQNALLAAQNRNQSAADKKELDTAAVGATAESVTVQASIDAAAAKRPPAPAPPPQLSEVPATGQNLALSSVIEGQLKKAPKVTLPNGVEALSVASAEKRIVAIDTSGALFLSEDNGRHWQPVPTQWTGRAVLVRNSQSGIQSAGLLPVPPARFELVNDKLQTWISTDGKTWTAESLRGK
jgi:hypothetical protein